MYVFLFTPLKRLFFRFAMTHWLAYRILGTLAIIVPCFLMVQLVYLHVERMEEEEKETEK